MICERCQRSRREAIWRVVDVLGNHKADVCGPCREELALRHKANSFGGLSVTFKRIEEKVEEQQEDNAEEDVE